MIQKPLSLIAAAVCGCLVSTAAAQEEAVPTAPPFSPPQLSPSLLDFLTGQPVALQKKLAKTPLLLQPPFAGAPIDTPKGLAADIKAKEVDVPNRIAAARYLGTLDCVAFPEARQMLLAMAQEDPFEPVRYEAVMALRVMLSRGMDNPQRAEHIAGCGCEKCKEREKQVKKIAKETKKFAHHAKIKEACPKNPCELVHKTLPLILHAPCKLCAKIKLRCQTKVPAEALRYDWCKGCCDAETLNALAKIANDLDEQGCPLEPSPRVRAAAADALLLCDCIPRPPQPMVPIPAPPVEPEGPMGEGPAENRGEGGAEVPGGEVPPVPEVPDVPDSERFEELDPSAVNQPRLLKTESKGQRGPVQTAEGFDPAAAAQAVYPPVSALRDYCIVALHDHRFVRANPEFSAVYKGRTYFFESAYARSRFEADPQQFAPAFCGMDPVCYVESSEVREGRLLREHAGRFYLFVDEANWETFLTNPSRFAAR